MGKRKKKKSSSAPLAEQLIEISQNHKKKIFLTQRLVEFSILLIIALIGSVVFMIYFFLQKVDHLETEINQLKRQAKVQAQANIETKENEQNVKHSETPEENQEESEGS